jgi:NADPH-dependent 2,4-dienoyl-CoA reductase/sulfur reductase-like enzyme
VIVGGGLAAQRCCERLRREGFDGRVIVVSEEDGLPYDRPPLSKAVLTDGRPPRTLDFRTADWYAQNGIELLPGVRAERLDPAARTIVLEHAGDRSRHRPPAGRLRYRRLLVASGSRPRRLPGLEPGGRVHELRTRDDAIALRAALLERGGRLLIVGAGLVGMEVASSARRLGLEVTMLEAAPSPLARALPPLLGRWLAGRHARFGVDVRLGTSVTDCWRLRHGVRAELNDGTAVTAQTVLVAAGSVPATSWLGHSREGAPPLATDALGRTALPGVYAAGDAACFPDPLTGEPLPTPHWEAAARQGVVVAHAISGTEPPADAPAMFWSDQHGSRIQFVGHVPAGHEIEIEGDDGLEPPFAAWISCGGRPAAAMLVDRPELMARARRLIAAAAPQIEEEEDYTTKEQAA